MWLRGKIAKEWCRELVGGFEKRAEWKLHFDLGPTLVLHHSCHEHQNKLEFCMLSNVMVDKKLESQSGDILRATTGQKARRHSLANSLPNSTLEEFTSHSFQPMLILRCKCNGRRELDLTRDSVAGDGHLLAICEASRGLIHPPEANLAQSVGTMSEKLGFKQS